MTAADFNAAMIFYEDLQDFAYSQELVCFFVYMFVCVCLSVKIIRIGYTLEKIKHDKKITFLDVDICHRMV